MSRDTNQNLYAEQIITESPFYYDEHGRLRIRVLEESAPMMRTADMRDRNLDGTDDRDQEKKPVAAPDTAPAAEDRPIKGGPAKPNPGIKPIAAAPPKETAEPVDVINAPNLRDTTDDTVYSTMPTQDKIKRGGNQSLPPLRPYLPSDDPTLRGAPTARPAVGIGRIGKGRVTDMRARPELGIGRIRDKIGKGRVTDMRVRLPGRGRITGINRRPIGGVRGGGTNVNVRPTRPGSSGNMYAESVEQSEE